MKLMIVNLPDHSTVIQLAQKTNGKTYALQIISTWAEQRNYINGWRKLIYDRIRQGRRYIRRSIKNDSKD